MIRGKILFNNFCFEFPQTRNNFPWEIKIKSKKYEGDLIIYTW